ncbi:hypothetical protein [Chitinophaga sp.]|uniref:hypothetical protein n=1 Tax=Chitinophaga sp. TaxID=1869181 RepID=UPI002FDCB913
MDINLSYNRAYVKELLRKSNMPNAAMLAGEAFGLMEWALNETIKGRTIVSLDLETEEAWPVLAYSIEHAKTLRADNPQTV